MLDDTLAKMPKPRDGAELVMYNMFKAYTEEGLLPKLNELFQRIQNDHHQDISELQAMFDRELQHKSETARMQIDSVDKHLRESERGLSEAKHDYKEQVKETREMTERLNTAISNLDKTTSLIAKSDREQETEITRLNTEITRLTLEAVQTRAQIVSLQTTLTLTQHQIDLTQQDQQKLNSILVGSDEHPGMLESVRQIKTEILTELAPIAAKIQVLNDTVVAHDLQLRHMKKGGLRRFLDSLRSNSLFLAVTLITLSIAVKI